MAGRQNYDPEVKAQAMAALLAGQGVGEVAKEYSIPLGTVKGWKSKAKKGAGSTVPTQKKEAIGDLLVGYVESILATVVSQNKVFADPEWIREQGAQEMAILHGVLVDKGVRILEAMGGPADEELPEED